MKKIITPALAAILLAQLGGCAAISGTAHICNSCDHHRGVVVSSELVDAKQLNGGSTVTGAAATAGAVNATTAGGFGALALVSILSDRNTNYPNQVVRYKDADDGEIRQFVFKAVRKPHDYKVGQFIYVKTHPAGSIHVMDPAEVPPEAKTPKEAFEMVEKRKREARWSSADSKTTE